MVAEQPINLSIINESLQKVAKGTGIIFVGTIAGLTLGFLQRVLIARYYTQEEYGVFSLAFVLFNIFAILATLGLQEGTARQIAYYRGKKDMKKVRDITISAIEISLVASIIFSLILFLTSNIISIKIFHEEKLNATLKILSISLPFFVLILIFTAIFRGFNEVKPKVYFHDISRNVTFILFLIIVIWLGLPFLGVIYALLLSIVISCGIFAAYILNRDFFLFLKNNENSYDSTKRELLFFSLPLIIAIMLNLIMSWTDTLMLGYFEVSNIVGLYNAAVPLARLIPTALSSAAFLYTPIVSQLYSMNLIKEMRRIYQVLTKWVFSATIPIFSILFLFPRFVLNFLFGINYVSAELALRILSIGFMFHTFLGLNGLTLMVLGKTKFLMLTSFVAAITNVVLDTILIPIYSIEGAAIASLSAYCMANILNSTKLYQLSKIHPFTWNYLKPIGISIVLLASIYIFASHFKVELWMLPVLLFIFLLSYFVLLLLTKSFDREDIEMFLAIEKSIGIDFGIVRKLLGKFV